MQKTGNFNNPKVGLICLIVVILLTSVLCSFLFFNSISLYSQFDVEYSELVFEELTFSKYEKLGGFRSDYRYIIYFEDYEKPFEINTISDKKLDKTALQMLVEGESIRVHYKESSSQEYDYEICELTHNFTVLLSLSDYVEINQSNQIAGMIICPIMVVLGLLFVGIILYVNKKINSETK